MFADDVVRAVVGIVIIVYVMALVIYLIRLVKGPSLFDKVIVVDAFSYDLTVFMALVAFYTGNPYMSIPMVLVALWAFTLDMYISKLVERGDIGE